MVVTQSNKLAKLESERQEWQRRIIEAEREKRVRSDFAKRFFLFYPTTYLTD
jgi:hypothetical protein